MKIACTALAAIAGSLAFTGSAAAFDRDAISDLKPVTNVNNVVNQNTRELVTRTVADMLTPVPAHPDAAMFPIALDDCADCTGAVIDNAFPALAGAVEPPVDLVNDPFFAPFIDFSLVAGDGIYNDEINGYFFWNTLAPNGGVINPDASTLFQVTGPSITCSFLGTPEAPDPGGVGTGRFYVEGDAWFIPDTVIAAADNFGDGTPGINLRVSYAYDYFIGVARNGLGPDSNPFGGFTIDVPTFGECFSQNLITFDLDDPGLLGITGPATVGTGWVLYIDNEFITPIDAGVTIEFFAPPPVGACCVGNSGTIELFEDCVALGGNFYGVDSFLSADGGADGGVVCENCDLDPLNGFYESSSDNFTADDVANLVDFNGGCGTFDAATNPSYSDTPIDSFDFLGSPINESVLGNRWVGSIYNYQDATGAVFNDIDYYTFQATTDATLTVDIEAATPTGFQIIALGADPNTGTGSDVCEGAGFGVVATGIAGDADATCTTSFLADVVGGQWYAVAVAPASAFGLAGLPTFQTNTVDPQDFINGNFASPELDASAADNLYAFTVTEGVQVTGACCFADGTTTEVFAADCAAAGGGFQGPGTTAADGLCCPNPWVSGGTDENEDEVCAVGPQPTQSDTLNDGCADDNTLSLVIPIALGETINGEHAVYTDVTGAVLRDRDVYVLNHTGGELTFELTAQFDQQLLIFNADTATCLNSDFDNIDVIDAFVAGARCTTLLETLDIPAGNIAIFISSFNPADGTVVDPEADCNQGIAAPLRYALTVTAPNLSTCATGCFDADGDGTVDIDDLLAVLGDFGNPVDGDGVGNSGLQTDVDCTGGNVDIDDLLQVLGAFGDPAAASCP